MAYDALTLSVHSTKITALKRLLELSWWHLLFLFILTVLIFRALFHAYRTPLRNTPGPWFAKFSRLWLLRAYAARSFHKTNLDLHRRYGESESLNQMACFQPGICCMIRQ